jgi:extracellular factor (EF) 3-hydroxypalmitic acid methyl ester biosynthesis protein
MKDEGPRSACLASPTADELSSVVRAAAEKLVDDLCRADKFSNHWSEAKLTEALVDTALSECLAELATTGCWGEANRLPSGELWRIAGSLLEVGTLQHCARFKPRGYAGDFEMLARICQRYRCDHPLGRAFDTFFQNQAAPQAVRARTGQTSAALVAHCLEAERRGCHVVSVGAGPAIDVRQALAMLPENRRKALRVTLLDLDPDALDYARQHVEPLLPPGGLACVRANLFRLTQGADAGAALENADFLACPGLFDYLADDAAAGMLELFWRRLSPGGRLLVGNFAPHNPTRAYMEWIGNWYLTYRTTPQLEQLALQAGIARERFTVGCEPLGVDLFIVGRKRES